MEAAVYEGVADVLIPMVTGKPRRKARKLGAGVKPNPAQVWAGIDRLAAMAPDRVREH